MNYLAKKNKRKALFLDRDGTINLEKGYVFRVEDFEFRPQIFDLIKNYQQKDFLIIVVTNQSGIARGFYTESEFHALSDWMVARFNEAGIKIEKIYHCPHHPDFTGECQCRKPKPGMILQAIEEFNMDPAECVLVGDKKSDVLAGKKAGIGKNLLIQNIFDKINSD
jgi:D-glycero-D-manno-heptose 1,7-bisphosphate phosphatase